MIPVYDYLLLFFFNFNYAQNTFLKISKNSVYANKLAGSYCCLEMKRGPGMSLQLGPLYFFNPARAHHVEQIKLNLVCSGFGDWFHLLGLEHGKLYLYILH